MSVLLLTLSFSVNAATGQSIASKIEVLKQQAVLLHKDLAQLEQDLIYPSTTQIAIYVSTNMDKGFTLGSIRLLVDNVVVTQSIYTQAQNYALNLGGMQRLYMGNLSVGDHHFEAIVQATDANDNVVTFKGEAAYYKNSQPLSLSLKLSYADGSKGPVLSVTRL
jgi:hypothetical protein